MNWQIYDKVVNDLVNGVLAIGVLGGLVLGFVFLRKAPRVRGAVPYDQDADQ